MNLEEHMLTLLAKECSEVAQQVCKSLRFGLGDRNVLDPTGPTNKERLINELNDLMSVLEVLESGSVAYVWNGVLPHNWQSREKICAKRDKIFKFVAYAKSVGALKP